MSEVIDGELIGTELVEYVPPQPPATLFGTDDPAAVVEAARRAAAPLAAAVRAQKLSVRIGPSEHVRVEGWTLLGSMLGVFPICVWTRPLQQDGKPHGWEARVEARTRDGSLVGAAEAQCTRDENQWSWEPSGRDGRKLPAREDYALRSMAQTRATSKALRQPLGFVMQLAGYNPTPAEEMPRDRPSAKPVPKPATGGIDKFGGREGSDPTATSAAVSEATLGASPTPEATSSQLTELPGETFEDIFQDSADPDADKVSLSAPQKKKLDVLVGQLRDAGRLHTEHLFAAVGKMRDVDPEDLARAMPGAIDDEGVLHYSPLRDTLSKAEASSLIERLSRLQENVEAAR